MILHGQELADPIRQFNDYGYMMCSTIAGANCAIWHHMGMDVRSWDVSLHTVSECFYEDRWHIYDNSMSALYTLCDGVTIADNTKWGVLSYYDDIVVKNSSFTRNGSGGLYSYYDIDSDGVEEKVVLTVEPRSQAVLRFIEFPYDHGGELLRDRLDVIRQRERRILERPALVRHVPQVPVPRVQLLRRGRHGALQHPVQPAHHPPFRRTGARGGASADPAGPRPPALKGRGGGPFRPAPRLDRIPPPC